MKRKNYFLIIVTFFLLFFDEIHSEDDCAIKPKKIIGLIAVRNEEQIIEQCLRALTYYVDSIIVLDDNSTDKTLTILAELCDELPIEHVICCSSSSWECRSERYNKQTLLDAGRQRGGTHFVIIDADEMFTAPCKKDNILRDMIYCLKPGQALVLQMPHLWRGMDSYRDDHTRWSPSKCLCGCIFCDDGVCNYNENANKSIAGFIHINRLPITRSNADQDILITSIDYSLMHFRFVNWESIIIKRAWYMCLELIRAHESLPSELLSKRTIQINHFYTCIEDFSEEGMILKSVNPSWFDYPFFDPKCFLADVIWRKKTVLHWFKKYGKDFFAALDIWNLSWD